MTDTSVILDGSIPGGGSTGGDSGGSWDDSLSDVSDDPACTPTELFPDRCYRDPLDPTDPTPAPVVTIADVATFAPALSPAVSEPGGWAIVGLPINLVGPSGTVTVDGVLLGAPAQVRFTPIAWHWSHGDGGAASLPTPGAAWAALGVAEFSPTVTSHVYAAPGTYRVTLEVDLIADYRIGAGAWLPMPGVLSIPVSGFDVLVATADTVLVDRDCRASPVGPGC